VRDFAEVAGAVIVVCALGLFLGGMVSAWREIRAEKRAGVRVTRPGWNRADREALNRPQDRYKAPRGSGVMWLLVAVGRADLAERYARRKWGTA
jgi:hypothetical protein